MTTVDDDLQTANAPATGGWRFDDQVTQSFESMLERSIPQYPVMRDIVTDVACWFAEADMAGPMGSPHPLIVDLGTSRGSALSPIVDRLGSAARYAAYEISEPMLRVCQERFTRLVADGVMEIHQHDLRDGYPERRYPNAAAILSVLTLQFVPIEYRQRILAGVCDHLRMGGAFIMVEKVLGATHQLNEVEVDVYHRMKAGHGYAQEAIDRKRLALEGVLVPLTARFNEELLHGAGFRQVDCVWAWMNFRCWVAVR